MPSLITAKDRISAYYLELLRKNSSDWSVISKEYPQISHALEHCLENSDLARILNFVEALSDYWFGQGPWSAFEYWSTVLLTADAFPNPDDKLRLLGQLAEIKRAQGEYREAQRLYKIQIEAMESEGLSKGGLLVASLKQLADISLALGDDMEAQICFTRLLSTTKEQGHMREQVDFLLQLTNISLRRGELEEANDASSEALAIAERIGYRIGMIDTLRYLGAIQVAAKDCLQARSYYARALDLAGISGDQIRARHIRSDLDSLSATMDKRVFISYNHNDRDFVEKLARDLRAECVGVWWDDWEIKVGHSIIDRINEGIDQSAYLAVVLSPDSVQSPFVRLELNSVLMRQLSARDIAILPLLIRDCQVPRMLLEIRRADFRQSYEVGFQQLLKTLLGTTDEHTANNS